MFNEKYSHEKKFTYDSSKNEFIELNELVNTHNMKEFPVRALFTYDAKYGTRACVVTDGFNVNVPKHLNDDVKSILSHDDEIAAINAGKCGFRVKYYIDSNNVQRISGNFFDM